LPRTMMSVLKYCRAVCSDKQLIHIKSNNRLHNSRQDFSTLIITSERGIDGPIAVLFPLGFHYTSVGVSLGAARPVCDNERRHA
jgi:hypothetical protein